MVELQILQRERSSINFQTTVMLSTHKDSPAFYEWDLLTTLIKSALWTVIYFLPLVLYSTIWKCLLLLFWAKSQWISVGSGLWGSHKWTHLGVWRAQREGVPGRDLTFTSISSEHSPEVAQRQHKCLKPCSLLLWSVIAGIFLKGIIPAVHLQLGG